MYKSEEKTFIEIFSEVCKHGNLKKDFRLVVKNIQTGCVSGVKTTLYSFKLNFIDVNDKRYVLSKKSNIEKEILSLYGNLKEFLALENERSREARKIKLKNTRTYSGSLITLFYHNEIIYQEELSAFYKLKLLDDKLISYINNDEYIIRNSLDISYINQDAFNSMGRLRKDYKLTIEYGMRTSTGISKFALYCLTDSDISYVSTAKLVNTVERILRYQKDIYKEKNDSLIYLSIYLHYQDKLIFERRFISFNTYILDKNGNKFEKNLIKFNTILNRLVRNRNSVIIPNEYI